ncbi:MULTISPECIES: hypothetical protein [unclassified Acinetobacter]|uniref:hypothetical protein n=1 Tax=unclassified Acinetobacter TaxID=196816 RepID=UPI0035B6AE72
MLPKFFSKIKSFFEPVADIPTWFFIQFDEKFIYVQANPPYKQAWSYQILWQDIIRVCFKDNGLTKSDCLYVWVSGQEQAYMIPTDAKGGAEFFIALNQRSFFPDDLMKQAAGSTDGGLYCYPTWNTSQHAENQIENQKNTSESSLADFIFYVFYAVVMLITVLSVFQNGLKHLGHYFTVTVLCYVSYFALQSWGKRRHGDAVSALIVVLILRWIWF